MLDDMRKNGEIERLAEKCRIERHGLSLLEPGDAVLRHLGEEGFGRLAGPVLIPEATTIQSFEYGARSTANLNYGRYSRGRKPQDALGLLLGRYV